MGGPLRKADHRQKSEMLDLQEDGRLKGFESWESCVNLEQTAGLQSALHDPSVQTVLSSRSNYNSICGIFSLKASGQISGACKKNKKKKADDVAAARLSYNSV